MEFTIATILTILTIAWIWIRYHFQAQKFPPGPWGLPIVGYLPFLGKYAHKTFLKLGEKHGNIFSVVLGNHRVVVLNDWTAVKAALVDQAQTFSGRPTMFLFDSTAKKRNIATKHGPIWKIQRSLTVQGLIKQDGPKRTARESLIMDNVNELVKKFEKQSGQEICFEDDIFFLPIFNIVWKMVCSKTIVEGDVDKEKFYQILKQNFYGLRNNSPVNFMPYLRYLVPGGFGYWTYVKHHNMLWSYLVDEIEEHQRTFKEGECRDFLDSYIGEIQQQKLRDEILEPPYTNEELAGTLYDMFLAGVESTTDTLTWSILILTIWPHVQENIQKELDEVVGRGRAPVIQDMPMLPYLEAVTLEIHRYVTVVPLSLFHSPLKDTEVLGHPIPKGCIVIENIYGVHRDPKCWDEPLEFSPERFLDTQNKVKKPPCHIPFSVGARMCLGEPLAKQMTFLFLACILQKFSFRLPLNSPKPSLEPIVGLNLIPQPFNAIINLR